MDKFDFYRSRLQSFKKVWILMALSSFMAYGQGPDPCPCDPTEGEAAYEACLAAHPECDEEIPIDHGISFLILAGLAYGSYTIYTRHKNQLKPVVIQKS